MKLETLYVSPNQRVCLVGTNALNKQSTRIEGEENLKKEGAVCLGGW